MSICADQNLFEAEFENNLENKLNDKLGSLSQSLSKRESTLEFPQAETNENPDTRLWNVFKQINIWVSRSRQRKDLANLDERLLADIGYTIEQAQVESSLPFWK